MKKISIKNLIDFKRRTEISRLTLINNIGKDKNNDFGEGGGDYWVSCLSAISNVFSTENTDLINQKVDFLINKISETDINKTKARWQKNIDILHNFEEYDFKSIKPIGELTFHKKPDSKSIIDINSLSIVSKPHHVFSYNNKDFQEIGAVWFVAKKDGYKKSELGMFSDIIYRYLNKHYSEQYKINPAFCIAVDVFNCQEVSYLQLVNGEVTSLLDSTVDEMKKIFMS